MKKNENLFDPSLDYQNLKEKFNTVLIIDDDPCYQDLVALYAKNFSNKIITANSTEKALNYLNKIDVNLIITDYFIPDKNFGSGIVESLKEMKKNIPVIIMSGDLDNLKENDYNLSKVNYFIDKPIDVVKLYELVKEIGA
jgi:DNA-binding NtrC family response regulator